MAQVRTGRAASRQASGMQERPIWVLSDRQHDRHSDKQTLGEVGGQTDRRKDGQTDAQADKHSDRQVKQTGSPEGLLAIPLVATQQPVCALASIIVGLLQADLGVLDIWEGYPKDKHSPGIAVGKVKPL